MRRDDDGKSKKQPFICCACRGTHEHRCYMCFCGNCLKIKKVPPKFGVKDRVGKGPSMDTRDKQPLEASDPCGGGDHPPGFSLKPSALRGSPPIRCETRADVAEDVQRSPRPSTVKEQRGNDEVENQKDGGSSKTRDGSTSIWDVLAEKQRRASENQMGWANKGGFSSSWGTKSWNEPRHNAANKGPSASSWGTKSWNEPRRNAANRTEEPRGTMPENKRRDIAPLSASSRGTIPVNQQRPDAAGFIRNWDAFRVDEARENKEVMSCKAGDGVAPLSSAPDVESGSRWTSCSGKRSRVRDVQASIATYGSRIRPLETTALETWGRLRTSCWNIAMNMNLNYGVSKCSITRCTGDQERLTTHRSEISSRQTKKPRGPQEITDNTTKDRDSETILLKSHLNSGSSRASVSVKESRGMQEVRAYSTRNGPCKSISCNPPSGSGSRRNAHIVEDARALADREEGEIPEDLATSISDRKSSDSKPQGVETTYSKTEERENKEREVIKTCAKKSQSLKVQQGGQGKLPAVKNLGSLTINDQNKLIRSGEMSPPQGNAEVRTNRAKDGSEQVLPNCRVQPCSSRDALTVEEPRENQGLIAYRAENGCSVPALHNPNVGFVSTPPSLTAKEATGCPVSDKESKKDGQHEVTTPCKKFEGIVKVDVKFSSPKHARVGPSLAIIWRGKFEIPDFPGDRICEVLIAHLAANVSSRAYKFAGQITDDLQFHVQPRRAFWPKIFQLKCPDNRDVALYFYPQRDTKSSKKYDKLLKFIEGQDLMLRSVMGGVELLVFSSKLLDSKSQTLEGNMYMWAVFRKLRSKEVSSTTKAKSSSNSTPGTAQGIANSSQTAEKCAVSTSLQKQM